MILIKKKKHTTNFWCLCSPFTDLVLILFPPKANYYPQFYVIFLHFFVILPPICMFLKYTLFYFYLLFSFI